MVSDINITVGLWDFHYSLIFFPESSSHFWHHNVINSAVEELEMHR